MPLAASKFISTVLASWMLVGCLLCSCMQAASAAVTLVDPTASRSADHACCETEPAPPPCHSTEPGEADHSGCAHCPTMKPKLAVNPADQMLAQLFLDPFQVDALSLISPLPAAGSPTATVAVDSAPPRPLATPVQMKCVLVL